MSKMTTLNVRLTVKEKEKIKEYADDMDLSITDYVKNMTLQSDANRNETKNNNDDRIKDLVAQNNYLKKQIDILNEDKSMLHQLLDQQQRLTLDSQNKIKQLEEPKEGKGFFSRLFGKQISAYAGVTS